jgi:uncharacterized protein YacL
MESVTNKFWRLFFTLLLAVLCAVPGWYAADAFLNAPVFKEWFRSNVWIVPVYRAVFTVVGAILGTALGRWAFRRLEIAGERLRALSTRDKVALGIGLVIGLLLTTALSVPILIALANRIFFGITLTLLIGTALTYLCIGAAISMKEEIRFFLPPSPQNPEDETVPPKDFWKIFDTNVIIDGRVADVAQAGFIEGPIYIPGFVLDELQHIADSSDGLKRARGRRGLDILNQMQKDLKLVVRTYDRLAPGHEEVDARLVRLAKAMEGSIVTNDFNLNKVAEIQGVQVLNINELANALKPVVLPGEEMHVAIVKDGKEPSQGVGYLDDGTMIVVEGGRRYIGQGVTVLVSSVLQTQAGKMIFAHMREPRGGGGAAANGSDEGHHGAAGYNATGSDTSAAAEEEDLDRGMRAYTSRRPRRPVR